MLKKARLGGTDCSQPSRANVTLAEPGELQSIL